MTQTTREKPVREFRAGTISAALWRKSASVNGKAVTQLTIRVQKRYKDERTGEWKTTTYFRPDDMPRLALVADRVFEFAVMREIGNPSGAVTTTE